MAQRQRTATVSLTARYRNTKFTVEGPIERGMRLYGVGKRAEVEEFITRVKQLQFGVLSPSSSLELLAELIRRCDETQRN